MRCDADACEKISSSAESGASETRERVVATMGRRRHLGAAWAARGTRGTRAAAGAPLGRPGHGPHAMGARLRPLHGGCDDAELGAIAADGCDARDARAHHCRLERRPFGAAAAVISAAVAPFALEQQHRSG